MNLYLPTARCMRAKQKATEILNSSSLEVTVDAGQLRELLDLTVRQTHNFNVEKLEKLHNRFAQSI